jgi:hypothetical protein
VSMFYDLRTRSCCMCACDVNGNDLFLIEQIVAKNYALDLPIIAQYLMTFE